MSIMLFKGIELALNQCCYLFDLQLSGLAFRHNLDNLVDRVVICELLLWVFEHSSIETRVPLVHKLREVLVADEALEDCDHEAKVEGVD